MSAKPITHEEIVTSLLNSKAIDFNAIGKAVAELGPKISGLDEPWEGFCGTMRRFTVLYKIGNPGVPVEQLNELSNAAGGLA